MHNVTNLELIKKCSLCESAKRMSDFALAKNRKDGRQSYCRSCFGEYTKVKRQIEQEKKAQEKQSLVQAMQNMMDDHILTDDVKQRVANTPSLGRVMLRDVFTA